MPRLLAPRYWGAHLLAVVAVAAAVLLGGWQYDAWQERRAAEAADLTQAEPVPLDDAIGPDDPFPGDRVGQPVVIDGTWVPEGTVLVSGREHEGADGYWVVTPVAVGGPDEAGDPGRARLGRRARTTYPRRRPGDTELVGWLQPPEGTGEADPDPADDVLPQVRTADLIQRVDQDLYGAYAVVTDDPATNAGTDGLEPATLEQLPGRRARSPPSATCSTPIEWWFFGAFALFIWWRWLRDEQAAGETEATPEPDPRGEPARTAGEGQ